MNLRLTILTIFFAATFSVSAQQPSDTQDIPVLINKAASNLYVVKDGNIKDSLHILYQVAVNFRYPLKNTSKPVQIDSVEVVRIMATSLTNGQKVIGYSFDSQKASAYQKYIWDQCYQKLMLWFQKQPYSKMPDRRYWRTRATFGGTFTITGDRNTKK